MLGLSAAGGGGKRQGGLIQRGCKQVKRKRFSAVMCIK